MELARMERSLAQYPFLRTPTLAAALGAKQAAAMAAKRLEKTDAAVPQRRSSNPEFEPMIAAALALERTVSRVRRAVLNPWLAWAPPDALRASLSGRT